MFIFSIFFLCGTLLFQFFPILSNQYFLLIIFIFILLQKLFFKKITPYIKIYISLLLGFIWTLWYVNNQLAWTLTSKEEGKPLQVTGIITTVPDIKTQQTSFRFLIRKIQFENHIEPVHATVQLSWQLPSQKLHVGDEWKFSIHLRKIKSLMNPGSFDYEAWCFQQGIRATGYIDPGSGILLKSKWYHHPVDRMREYLRDKISEGLAKSRTSFWIIALAIGERSTISPDDWRVLRNTGTNHLLAIAGLHIGFMAAFTYNLITWIWRRCPRLIMKIPAQHAGAIAALIMALIYSAMAGFSLPTQRACLMLLALLITVLLRRKLVSWHSFSLALLCILLLNPLNVLTASFWLSFSAIAFIIYGTRGRLAPSGLWWKHGRIQWVITLGLIPLGIGLFQECSLISFIANSIAIPCVGFLVVPLVLTGCFLLLFSVKIGGIVLWLADKMITLLWLILTYLANLSWGSWYQGVSGIWYVVAACIGMVMLLLPIGFPGRGLGIIWLLPLILYKPAVPPLGDVWLTLLDVEQGLSAVVQTNRHTLVFDAGSRFSEKNDMGAQVVVPFLHSLAINHVDRLVISHGDNDHIGGSLAILKQFPVYLVKSSVPDKFLNVPANFCIRGETWQWDDVTFQFLYPVVDKLGLNNDSSCVLRITSGVHHILLTGDIEKIAEQYLIDNAATSLAADILVAPHHGSKTSALDEFINLVHPQIVLFSVGYRNRYHFPNPFVVQKYRDIGAISFDTVQSGAIQLKLSKYANSIAFPLLYRTSHFHY